MHQDVIIAPVISEKSMNDAAQSKFTFKVARDTNKKAIRKEIEAKFKVNVISVATSIVKGKRRKQGIRRIEVVSSSWKKAIVKLKEGQKIDLFDIAQGEKK